MPSQGPEAIRIRLVGLDGVRCSPYILAKVPEGVAFERCGSSDFVEFVQCARSASHLVIQLRRREASSLRHYAVGRSLTDEASERTVVEWGGRTVDVPSNEGFDARAAIPLFLHYYESGEVSSDLTLRGTSL